MTKDNIGRGTLRVLHILETVADRGPLTLEMVVDATGISRMASYRALKILEGQGWIRAQMGSGAFVVTAKFVNRMRRAHRTYDEIDRLLPTLKTIAATSKIHFDIAVIEDLFVPRVIESNRRNRIDDAVDFFRSPFSLVALAVEDPRMRLMVLRAAMDGASDADKDSVKTGEINSRIRSIGKLGHAEDQATRGLIIPLSGYGNFSGAIRVSSALAKQPRMAVVRAVVEELQSGKFPNIPTVSAIQDLNL